MLVLDVKLKDDTPVAHWQGSISNSGAFISVLYNGPFDLTKTVVCNIQSEKLKR